MPTFLNYQDVVPDPGEIERIYSSGFRGVRHDPVAYQGLRRSTQRFYAAHPLARDHGKGRASLPYKAALALDPEFGKYERQTTGDCVSHSTRNAGMMDYCQDVVYGEIEWEGRFATEPIYGYRGHGGQGASCSRLASYVSSRGPGGFLVRKNYEGVIDLSRYNSNIGHNWGRRGTPSAVNQLADDRKATKVYACKSVQEARDALACGYGISMCSGLGFSNRRDQNGVSNPRGSWAHAMAWVGVDDTDSAHQIGGPLFLVQNSWGTWNGGPKRHDQPDGSFWITSSVAARMIRGGGGWIIESVKKQSQEYRLDRSRQMHKESRQ